MQFWGTNPDNRLSVCELIKKHLLLQAMKTQTGHSAPKDESSQNQEAQEENFISCSDPVTPFFWPPCPCASLLPTATGSLPLDRVHTATIQEAEAFPMSACRPTGSPTTAAACQL